jgi:hypothetical protein
VTGSVPVAVPVKATGCPTVGVSGSQAKSTSCTGSHGGGRTVTWCVITAVAVAQLVAVSTTV